MNQSIKINWSLEVMKEMLVKNFGDLCIKQPIVPSLSGEDGKKSSGSASRRVDELQFLGKT